jgi:Protein of unknown function (DUF3349)
VIAPGRPQPTAADAAPARNLLAATAGGSSPLTHTPRPTPARSGQSALLRRHPGGPPVHLTISIAGVTEPGRRRLVYLRDLPDRPSRQVISGRALRVGLLSKGFENMALPHFLSRIIGWLRAGYPEGVPEVDYIPLFALLGDERTGLDTDRDRLRCHGEKQARRAAHPLRPGVARTTWRRQVAVAAGVCLARRGCLPAGSASCVRSARPWRPACGISSPPSAVTSSS